MLLFCPACSNMLTVSRIPDASGVHPSHAGKNRFECRSCPYQYVLEKRYYERKIMKRKQVEDIRGGAGSLEHLDKVEIICPNEKCDSRQAYWYALQIRSADEPMTNFYTCMKCKQQWKD